MDTFASYKLRNVKALRNSIMAKYLLVVLFVSYYIGGVAFTHTHYYHQHFITHSHPYLPGSDGLPHHSHTTVAFETIEVLSAMIAEALPLLLLGVGWMLLALILQSPRSIMLVRSFRDSNLRAPPYCI